jgi:hypothetical protein
MGPEMLVHKWLKTQLIKKYPDVYVYKPRAGTYGKRGVPDFLCCINGLFVAIEVKTNHGKLTLSQEAELMKISVAGGLSYTIYGKNIDTLEKIFQDIEDTVR